MKKKYSDHDVDLLTKMEVTIPMNTQELRNHIKNFAGLAGHVIGAKSLLYENLLDVTRCIEIKEISYNYEFRQDKLFGGNFLDRIHWRVHRFFRFLCDGR